MAERQINVPYALVPLWWSRKLRGKPTAMMVAHALAYYARNSAQFECFPGLQTIANELGIHLNRAVDAVEALRANGILTKRRRARQTAVFTLNYNSPGSSDPLQSHNSLRSGEHDSPRSGVYDSPTSRQSKRSIEKSLLKESIDHFKKTTAPPDAAIDDERNLNLAAVLSKHYGLTPKKARSDISALLRQAKGDRQLMVAWLDYSANISRANNVVAYAMKGIGTGDWPPQRPDAAEGVRRI